MREKQPERRVTHSQELPGIRIQIEWDSPATRYPLVVPAAPAQPLPVIHARIYLPDAPPQQTLWHPPCAQRH
jgi:hypothetical protein